MDVDERKSSHFQPNGICKKKLQLSSIAIGLKTIDFNASQLFKLFATHFSIYVTIYVRLIKECNQKLLKFSFEMNEKKKPNCLDFDE